MTIPNRLRTAVLPHQEEPSFAVGGPDLNSRAKAAQSGTPDAQAAVVFVAPDATQATAQARQSQP